LNGKRETFTADFLTLMTSLRLPQGVAKAGRKICPLRFKIEGRDCVKKQNAWVKKWYRINVQCYNVYCTGWVNKWGKQKNLLFEMRFGFDSLNTCELRTGFRDSSLKTLCRFALTGSRPEMQQKYKKKTGTRASRISSLHF